MVKPMINVYANKMKYRYFKHLSKIIPAMLEPRIDPPNLNRTTNEMMETLVE